MRYTSLVIAIAVLMLGACSDSEHEVNKSRPLSNQPSTPSDVMESMSADSKDDMAGKSDDSMAAEVTEMAGESDDSIVSEVAEEIVEDSEEVIETVEKEVAEAVDRSDSMMTKEDMAKELAMEEKLAEQKTFAGEMMDESKEAMADGSKMMDKSEEVMESAAEEAAGAESMAMASVSMEEGTALAKKGGCFACHAIDRKILGPGWKDVAAKYADDKAAGKTHLLNKVAKGGAGVWTDITGGAAMPPYSPRVSDEDIETLVDFILAL